MNLEESGAPKIAFLTVAGRAEGIGHLSRTRLLSRYLQVSGLYQSKVIVLADSLGSIALERDESLFPRRNLEDRERFKKILGQVSVVIIDFPWWEPEYYSLGLKLLQHSGSALSVGIGDPLGLRGLFDMVFIPSFLSPEDRTSGATRIRFGWDCFLLPNRVHERNPLARRLLVATGGSDRHRLGDIWPKLLDSELPSDFSVTWVQGPLADNPILPSPSRLEFEVLQGEKDLRQVISSTEIGLSVYGVTAFELLASGVPTVTYSPYGEKDSLESAELSRLGIAEVAKSPEDAAQKIGTLSESNFLRSRLSRAALEKFPVSGEEIFLREIRSLVTTQRFRSQRG